MVSNIGIRSKVGTYTFQDVLINTENGLMCKIERNVRDGGVYERRFGYEEKAFAQCRHNFYSIRRQVVNELNKV